MSRLSVYFTFIFGEKDRSSDLPGKGRGETHKRREVEGVARVSVWVLQGKGRAAGCREHVKTTKTEWHSDVTISTTRERKCSVRILILSSTFQRKRAYKICTKNVLGVPNDVKKGCHGQPNCPSVYKIYIYDITPTVSVSVCPSVCVLLFDL